MLVLSFPAAVLATNCYVLAPAPGRECVVVDPGIGVTDQLRQVLDELDLTPVATIITHGHLDHVHAAGEVARTEGGSTPIWIHAADRYRLSDPFAGLGPELLAMFTAQFGHPGDWQEPADVHTFTDGQVLELAGLSLTVIHAPGHTEGSSLLSIADVPEGLPAEAEVTSTVLTGDVLFAGSIGRTDLPGGDHDTMLDTLRERVLTLPDDALVLPGHGPASTVARERSTNPYLQTL